MGVKWFAKKSSSEDVSTRIKRANIADGYNADYLLIPNDSMAVSQIAKYPCRGGVWYDSAFNAHHSLNFVVL